MLSRLAAFVRQILVSFDQLAQVLLIGPLYVVGLASDCPSADETISSYVGRGARRDAWWARIAVPVIDGAFVLLGEDWGHCERNVETAFAGEAPTP